TSKDAIDREIFEMCQGRFGLVDVIKENEETENESDVEKRKLKEVNAEKSVKETAEEKEAHEATKKKKETKKLAAEKKEKAEKLAAAKKKEAAEKSAKNIEAAKKNKQAAQKEKTEKAKKEAAEKKKAEMQKVTAKKKEQAEMQTAAEAKLKDKMQKDAEEKKQSLSKKKEKNKSEPTAEKVYLKSPFMNKMVKTQDKLDEVEILCARSVFCLQGDISEVVFDDGKGTIAQRKEMQSLAPGIEIEKQIIDTLVTVLNYEERIRTEGKDFRRRYFPTDAVKVLFLKYLQKHQHPFVEKLLKDKPAKVLKMKWKTGKNKIDSGLYMMMHMKLYQGEPASNWKSDIVQENNRDYDMQMTSMRMRYKTKILMHEMNTKRGSMSGYAKKFSKDNKDEENVKKMVENAINRKIAEKRKFKPKSNRKKQLPRSECKKNFPSKSNCQVWIASNEKYLQSKAEKEAKRKRKRKEKKSLGRWTRSDETKLLAKKHKRIKKQQAYYQETTKNKDKGKEEVVDVEQESEMNERLKKQKQAETEKKEKSRTEEKRRMNILTLIANTLGSCENNSSLKFIVLRNVFEGDDLSDIDWCSYILECASVSKVDWSKKKKKMDVIYYGPVMFLMKSTSLQKLKHKAVEKREISELQNYYMGIVEILDDIGEKEENEEKEIVTEAQQEERKNMQYTDKENDEKGVSQSEYELMKDENTECCEKKDKEETGTSKKDKVNNNNEEGLEIETSLMDVYVSIHSYEEIFKMTNMKRHFFYTSMMVPGILEDKTKEIDKKIDAQYDRFHEILSIQMENDVEKMQMEDVELRSVFGRHMFMYQNTNADKILTGSKKATILKMKWRTTKEKIDSGLYMIMHMDLYERSSAAQGKTGLLPKNDKNHQMQMDNLRSRIVEKILLH
nr:ulp1 protease family, C-terminal catalytic domain-containing protein [Tanacetum cinerariifolium]